MALTSVVEDNSCIHIVKKESDSKYSSEPTNNGIVCHSILKKYLFGEKIAVLKLTDLKLSEIPEELPELSHLREVNFSGNLLHNLPDKLILAKRLRILNLSKNEFRSVPNCLSLGLLALKDLNLSNNYLTDFSTPPASLPLLKELNLSHNLIEKFPVWIVADYVYMLEVLDLSFNPCFKIWYDFKVPAKNRIRGIVKTLKLKNTNFSIVSLNLLLYFPDLISLDLSNCNKHQSLQNTISHFPNGYLSDTLEELYLQGIDLSSAPQIANLKELKILDLSSNVFYWYPVEYLPPNLRYINLTHTMFTNLQDCFEKLAFLTHLMLPENDISSMASAFNLLINLEVLDLYNNVMETMPDLRNLSKLKGLDIWLNYFEPSLRPLGDEGPSYEDLKSSLRQNFGFQSRLDAVKQVVEENNYSERSNSYCSSSPEVSFTWQEVLTERNKSEVDEEDWNVEGNDEDWFDPTVDPTYQKAVYKEILSRDFGKNCLKYCSSDIQHSPHLFQPYAERVNTECWKQRRILMEVDYSTAEVDGQFDDA